MKKIILFFAFLLATITIFSQNEFKYDIYGYGGLKIGSEDRIESLAKIDSFNVVGDNLTFYVGSTPYYATITETSGGVSDSIFNTITFTPISTISSPSEGEIYYDSDDDLLLMWNGSQYDTLNVTGSGSGDMVAADTLASADPQWLTARQVDSLVTADALLASDTSTFYNDYGIDLSLNATEDTLTIEVDTSEIATQYDLTQITGASYDSTYIHYRVDSLVTAFNNLQLSFENLLAAVSNLGVDVVAPHFLSAELGTYNDSIVLVLYDTTDIHQDSIPPVSAFALTEDGDAFGISAITINQDSLFIALDSVGLFGSTYLLSYTGDYPFLQDSSGNKASNFSGQTVTNNVADVAAGYVTQYESLLTAMTTPPSGDTLVWQNALVDSLVTNGYWDRMDLLYIMANNNADNALLNWKNPGGDDDLTISGSPTFTAYEGFTGDETAAYLNTNYIASTEAVNITQNSISVGAYSRTNYSTSQGSIEIGGRSDSQSRIELSIFTGTEIAARLNSVNAITTTTITNAQGFTIASRTASDAQEVYRNGVSVISNTGLSTGLPAANMYLLAHNNAGITEEYSPFQLSIVFVMDGLSDSEVANINILFEQYMDHINKGVQ